MKEHMFDQSETTEGKDRSRLIIAVSSIALLLVVALVIIVASRPPAPGPGEQEWPVPGSQEFDSYAPNIVVDQGDTWISTTLIGRRLAVLKANVTNNGDRTIVGLKIKASALGFGGETLASRTATPVPRQKDTLAAGDSAKIEIQLDPIPPKEQIQSFTMQVVALRLK